jgi:hypothetical protein
MARGGKRDGAGRPVSSTNRMSREAREKAAESGQLPHEFLLSVSRGEMIGGHIPTFKERMDAANAAAPYYAPKLSSVEATGKDGGPIEFKEVTDKDRAKALAAFVARAKARE